jgi:hypothetical protein
VYDDTTYAAVEVLDDQLAVLNRGHRHEGEPSASARRTIVQHLSMEVILKIKSTNLEQS